jgi:hypothetical protein
LIWAPIHLNLSNAFGLTTLIRHDWFSGEIIFRKNALQENLLLIWQLLNLGWVKLFQTPTLTCNRIGPRSCFSYDKKFFLAQLQILPNIINSFVVAHIFYVSRYFNFVKFWHLRLHFNGTHFHRAIFSTIAQNWLVELFSLTSSFLSSFVNIFSSLFKLVNCHFLHVVVHPRFLHRVHQHIMVCYHLFEDRLFFFHLFLKINVDHDGFVFKLAYW